MLSATTSTLFIATTKVAAVGRHHKRGAAAFGRGTSSVVSFVVAMNRVDVVDLVVDLVDVDLDVDLVDVVSLSSGCILIFGPRLFFGLLAPGCISQSRPPAVFRPRHLFCGFLCSGFE